jgi:hypothetical protein
MAGIAVGFVNGGAAAQRDRRRAATAAVHGLRELIAAGAARLAFTVARRLIVTSS